MSSTSSPSSSTPSAPRRRSPSPPAFSAKYEHIITPLPRRPPPTALRLISGPLPSRARPKHTLPSLPRPTFHPKTSLSVPRSAASGPTPRKKAKEALVLEKEVPAIHLATVKFPDLKVPGYGSDSADSSSESGNWSDGESDSGSESGWSSRRGSIESALEEERGRSVRGPWDHAGTIKVPFDVNAMLTPPRRAAVSVPLRA